MSQPMSDSQMECVQPSSFHKPELDLHGGRGQAENKPSSSSAGILLKHEFQCSLSLNNMVRVVLFCVLKALKSNFAIFAPVDKALMSCLITFFLHCSIILNLYVYFSTFIKRFRAWLVTNFDKRFYELTYKLNKIPDFFKIQSWIILHHAQTQANMMDSWETMYIISVGMLWYDNCAINIWWSALY